MMDHFSDRLEDLRAKASAPPPPIARPSRDGRATRDDIRIHNEVLPDPDAYRRMVLGLEYRSITIGPVTFHGIAEIVDSFLPDWIAAHCPHAHPQVTFIRRSPDGQPEPNLVHTDRDMGEWTGILYLNPTPPPGDGTAFFQDRHTGARASTAETPDACLAEWHAWRDRTRWARWGTARARYNRLVLFPAPLFHARAIPENYGVGNDARLIQVVFGTGSLREGA